MKRILIVESDEEQSQRLYEAIERWGDYDVSLAMTVREACLLIAQQPFDLALVPAAGAAGARRALHALQPELPLAVVASGLAEEADSGAFGDVHGVIFIDELREELQQLLGITGQVKGEPGGDTLVADLPELPMIEAQASPDPEDTAATGNDEAGVTGANLQQILESGLGSDQIVGGIVTATGEIMALAGSLSEELATSIAQRISLTWHEGSSALLQFVRPSDRASDLLLFTRPAAQSTLLTLAAAPDYSVGQLRRAADELAMQLGGLDNGQDAADSRKPSRGVRLHDTAPAPARETTFALVIQPKRPFPAALQAAVAKALPEVAESAGCTLHYQQVDAELVHIVTTCPGEYSSRSVAQLYKKRIQARIEKQFGVPAQLWRRGFYAAESDQPLSDVELRLFVDR